MAIIDELKMAIQASGKSFNQLETEIGLGRGVLSRFAKGQRDIGLETAEKVAEYFGLYLCPSEAELDRTAKRIAAMREEAENAQSRLMKVQESLAVLLRVSEGGGAEIATEMLRRRKGDQESDKVPNAVAAKATPQEVVQPTSPPKPRPGTTYVASRMLPGSQGRPHPLGSSSGDRQAADRESPAGKHKKKGEPEG